MTQYEKKLGATPKKKLSGKKIALIVVASFFVLIFVAIFAIFCPYNLYVEEDVLNHAYQTVLSDLDGVTTANPRVIDLALLGAHDSYTGTMDPNGYPVDMPDSLRAVRPLVNGFVYRYAHTQAVSVTDLLSQGVRFFTMKVGYMNNSWITSHSIYCGEFYDILIEYLTFLESHPGEYVMIYLILQASEKPLCELQSYIDSVTYHGKNLHDYMPYGATDNPNTEAVEGKKLSELRYNDITNNGTSAGTLIASELTADDWTSMPESRYFDTTNTTRFTWHFFCSEKEVTAGIEEEAAVCAQPEYADYLRINQSQGAFTVRTLPSFFGCITGGSLLKIAQEHNNNIISRDDFDQILTAMPIYSVDYATSTKYDFNNRVNALIKEHNQKLIQNLL